VFFFFFFNLEVSQGEAQEQKSRGFLYSTLSITLYISLKQ